LEYIGAPYYSSVSALYTVRGHIDLDDADSILIS